MRMSALPPLDLHAHIDTSVPADDLAGLGAVVFAATRSLTEAALAVQRHDDRIIWGVGIHPGLARSHTGFDHDTFTQLIDRTPLVSEIGLDGKSRVPMDRQQATLRRVLAVLARTPRIASIHQVLTSTNPNDSRSSRVTNAARDMYAPGGERRSAYATAD